MNRFLLLLFGLAATATAAAQPRLDSLWDAANAHYTNKDYALAAAAYSALIEEHHIANPHLYYNVANAFFKQNDIAKAILYYEKALKLAPNNEDILHNLHIAREHTIDRIDAVPAFFLVEWFAAIPKWAGAETWGVLSLLTFATMLVVLLLIKVKRRQGMMYIVVVLLVVSLATLRLAVVAKQNAESQEYAVVMLPVTTVKSSPDNSSTDLFILHEGTRLQTIETIGEWVKIRIADGNQGWMPKNGIETI